MGILLLLQEEEKVKAGKRAELGQGSLIYLPLFFDVRDGKKC